MLKMLLKFYLFKFTDYNENHTQNIVQLQGLKHITFVMKLQRLINIEKTQL